MYTFARNRLCDCTAGTWVCLSPWRIPTCPPGAVYADPTCTEPYVNIEGDAATDDARPRTRKVRGTAAAVRGRTPVCCSPGLTPMGDYSCERDFGAAVLRRERMEMPEWRQPLQRHAAPSVLQSTRATGGRASAVNRPGGAARTKQGAPLSKLIKQILSGENLILVTIRIN